MSSESKDENAKPDNDVSRFTVDGVVAEMLIDIEDNDPSKSQKSGNDKESKSNAETSSDKSPEDEANKETADEPEASKSKSDNSKSSVIEKTYSVVNADGIEEKITLIEDKNDAVKEVNEEDDKSDESEDEDLEMLFEKEPVKKGRGRPKKVASTPVSVAKGKKQVRSVAREGTRTKEQSKNFKTRSSIASTKESLKTKSLKRAKSAPSSDEEDAVPEKRTKKSSDDVKNSKKRKKLLSFTPGASKVKANKRLALQKTSNTATPTRGRPKATTKLAASKLATGNSGNRPTRSMSTPVNKGAPKKGTPTKTSPNSSKATPSLSKNTKTYSKGGPSKNASAASKQTSTPIKATASTSKGEPAGKVKPSKSGPASRKADGNLKAWDVKPDGSLYSFPEILKQVKQAPYKGLRNLHHTIVGEVLARDLEPKKLKQEILEFRGFIFKEGSDAYERRLTILKRMSDSSIYDIVKILNVKKRSIAGIMAFLMKPASFKPSEVIYYSEDPNQESWQPVVKLQIIPLDAESKGKVGTSKSFKKGKIAKISSPRTSSSDSDDSVMDLNDSASGNETVLGKRKRFPSTKLKFYDIQYLTPSARKKASLVAKSPAPPAKTTVVKKKIVSEIARKNAIKVKNLKKVSLKNAAVKKAKQRARQRSKPVVFNSRKMPISSDLKIRRKALELALEIQETTGQNTWDSIEENDKFVLPDFEYETDIKQEVESEEEGENKEKEKTPTREVEENRSENASSEVTLSSDEAKEAMATQKKRCYKTTAIPLRSYPSIKNNIMTAEYSPLQRLHIVLFGASDKASNLKGNLLSFGGFPFRRGSDEWKQKRFLLSLLSKNTLKEYLDILAINHADDEEQPSLISKFMNFLAAPIENKPNDNSENLDDAGMETESAPESSDEYIPPKVILPKVVSRKKVSVPVVKKNIVKKAKPKSSWAGKGSGSSKKARKVLMDEAQVRRLEADLAREQRILERERKLHDEEVKRLGLSSYRTTLPQSLSITAKPTAMKQPLAENETDSELLNALLDTIYKRRELKAKGAKVSIPNKGGHTRLGQLANVKFLVVTANYNDLDVLHHLIYMSEATKSRVRKNILDFAGFNFAEDSPAYQNRMDFLTSLGYDISRRIAFLLGLCPYRTLIAQRDLNELIMYFLMSPCQSKQVPIRHLPTTFFGNDMPAELSALVQKHGDVLSIDPLSAAPTQQITLQIAPPQTQDKSLLVSSAAPRAKKSFRSLITSTDRLGLSPSISTLPLKSPQRPGTGKPSPTVLTQKQIRTSVTSSTTSDIAAQALARGIATATASTSPNPQEFYIQQQTPDGKQKTFKLIKLPASHPLNTVMRNQTPTTGLKKLQPILPGPKPTGVTLNKSNQGQVIVSEPVAGEGAVAGEKTAEIEKAGSVADEGSEKDSALPVQCNLDQEGEEELRPLEDGNPPTDDELFSCIRDIIHSCPSLEDITLRNVISRVTTKYFAFDLTSRHNFMKQCVKKVIMGE